MAKAVRLYLSEYRCLKAAWVSGIRGGELPTMRGKVPVAALRDGAGPR